jgi:hypothetical protein
MRRLKSICYRGGIVRIEIPASWKEEYEPSGGAIFYDDRPDSGTLRLSVLSFSSNGKESGDQMVASLIATNGYQPLHDGMAIKQYMNPADEEGERLHIHYWEVAVPVEGCSARLAVFSYTILASQAQDREVQEDIMLLERCIQSANYSREPGASGEDQRG